MPAWTKDSGTMARLNAGQPVRIIVIGSFSTTGLWNLFSFPGCVRRPGRPTAEGRPLSSVRYCCIIPVAPTSTRL